MMVNENVTESSADQAAIQLPLSLALGIVIITGNVFVVAAYFSNARIRTGTYTILASLAISDLLVGCISIPMWIFISLTSERLGSVVNDIFEFFDIFSALASSFHLTTVSMERWFAIRRPFIYGTLTKVHYSLILCGAWISSFAFAAIRPAILKATSIDGKKIYTLFLCLVGYVGPGILVIALNYSIFKVARRLIKSLPTSTEQQCSESTTIRRNIKKQRRTALTLIFVTAMFLISWSKFFIVNIIFCFCDRCKSKSKNMLTPFLVFAKWLQYSNSAINPMVYAFRDAEIRKTFVRLLGPCGRVFEAHRIRRVKPAPNTRNLCWSCTN
ncbi:adenosine receptor A2a-like [Montipora foliosa]|uniref:adenosine receptor A2a-like n=1 Tax=Montipora foliosa TaxID=591990 RepID=UPI0035F1DF82